MDKTYLWILAIIIVVGVISIASGSTQNIGGLAGKEASIIDDTEDIIAHACNADGVCEMEEGYIEDDLIVEGNVEANKGEFDSTLITYGLFKVENAQGTGQARVDHLKVNSLSFPNDGTVCVDDDGSLFRCVSSNDGLWVTGIQNGREYISPAFNPNIRIMEEVSNNDQDMWVEAVLEADNLHIETRAEVEDEFVLEYMADDGNANVCVDDDGLLFRCDGSSPITSSCGNQVCEGHEFVTCSNDCSYNVNNPLIIYDVHYHIADAGPSSDYINFKLYNAGYTDFELLIPNPDPEDEDNISKYKIAFVGNGAACNYNGFSYLVKPLVANPNTGGPSIIHGQETIEFNIAGTGNAPLFADYRHCENLFRIGVFDWEENNFVQCPGDELGFNAITNTVLHCDI